MRTTTPAPFTVRMTGPDGAYDLAFRPTDDWDGVIDTVIGGVAMTWHVVTSDLHPEGGRSLGGMTIGTDAAWGDQFWFELVLGPEPSTITYWGNQVVWRVDHATDATRA